MRRDAHARTLTACSDKLGGHRPNAVINSVATIPALVACEWLEWLCTGRLWRAGCLPACQGCPACPACLPTTADSFPACLLPCLPCPALPALPCLPAFSPTPLSFPLPLLSTQTRLLSSRWEAAGRLGSVALSGLGWRLGSEGRQKRQPSGELRCHPLAAWRCLAGSCCSPTLPPCPAGPDLCPLPRPALQGMGPGQARLPRRRLPALVPVQRTLPACPPKQRHACVPLAFPRLPAETAPCLRTPGLSPPPLVTFPPFPSLCNFHWVPAAVLLPVLGGPSNRLLPAVHAALLG